MDTREDQDALTSQFISMTGAGTDQVSLLFPLSLSVSGSVSVSISISAF